MCHWSRAASVQKDPFESRSYQPATEGGNGGLCRDRVRRRTAVQVVVSDGVLLYLWPGRAAKLVAATAGPGAVPLLLGRVGNATAAFWRRQLATAPLPALIAAWQRTLLHCQEAPLAECALVQVAAW
jgi:hypothetical protein